MARPSLSAGHFFVLADLPMIYRWLPVRWQLQDVPGALVYDYRLLLVVATKAEKLLWMSATEASKLEHTIHQPQNDMKMHKSMVELHGGEMYVPVLITEINVPIIIVDFSPMPYMNIFIGSCNASVCFDSLRLPDLFSHEVAASWCKVALDATDIQKQHFQTITVIEV